MAEVQIHAPEGKNGKVIQHDCSDFPDDPKYGKFKLTRPHVFRDGDVVDLPDDVADYFCRAGWAAKVGADPVSPPAGRPVFVQPDNIRLSVQSQNS